MAIGFPAKRGASSFTRWRVRRDLLAHFRQQLQGERRLVGMVGGEVVERQRVDRRAVANEHGFRFVKSARRW